MADCIGILLDYLRRHHFFRVEVVLREEVSLRQQLNGPPLVPWSNDHDLPLASTSGRELPFGPSYHWSTKAECIGYILDYLRRHHFSRVEAVMREEVSLQQQLNGPPLVPSSDDLDPLVALTSGMWQHQGAQMHHEVEVVPDKRANDKLVTQGTCDTVFTTRNITFANVHNLDQCIHYFNQSLVTLGFAAKLDLLSTEPALVARTCNCIYALIQQLQRDIEFRGTADETRLLLEMAELHVKVETLTDQLANKDGGLQAIKIKGVGTHEDSSMATRLGLIRRQGLRQDGEVGEKVKLEHKMRQWQESKHETLLKILPPRSPMRPKSPAHDQLCPFSPSTKTVKRALGADSTFLTPRSRFSKKVGLAVSQANVSFLDEGLSISTPNSTHSLAVQLDSESLTPFQQFQQKNPNFQMTLVKQYLSVLNTATRQELLQLKGIGPKRAADILDLRQNCEEPFKDLQDLKNMGLSSKEAFVLFNSNIVQKVTFPSS